MPLAIEMVLTQNLKDVTLSTMVSCLAESSRQARERHQSDEECLLGLTETELRVRAKHRLIRRLREARVPLMKPLEAFQFERAGGLDVRQIRELCEGASLRQHRNVILLGNSGTGKTHLATGLGSEACTQGFRTRVVTGCGLANELLEAREERSVSRLMTRDAGDDLLIVDERGSVPCSKAGAEWLFHVLADRPERKSVIVTTNLGCADWTQVFGDATLTAALRDRVTHQAVIRNYRWERYRLHQSLRQQVTTSADAGPVPKNC